MARRPSKILTEVELEFMQVLWEHKELTSDGIQEVLAGAGRDITGGSIRKILAILMRKGYLVRRKEGKSYFYRTVLDKKHAQGGLLGDMLDRAFSGSAPHLVAALLDSQPVPEKDLDAIERLIARRRKELET